MKKAKIVCTIGPASRDAGILAGLIDAGMDVARVNFSHGTHDEHREVIRRIRDLSDTVAVMQDLQGPKIRVGEIGGEGMKLAAGDEVTLFAGEKSTDPREIPVTYPALAGDVAEGNSVYINDGIIHLEVIRVSGGKVICRVLHGGIVTSRKGINLPGARISSPAMTGKDRADLEFGLGIGVDFVALSFVRSPEEVRELKGMIKDSGSSAGVVAR